jgi:cobalt-zinc-cadmium efflux system protein
MAAEHDHDHGISAGTANRSRLSLVLAITASVLVVEVVGALISGSLALLADAGHILTDIAGLTMALIAARLAGRPMSDLRTWGFLRAEVLAAAAQAAVLLAVGGYILVEGVRHLFSAPTVSSPLMVVFGLVGLAGNAIAIGVLARSRADNLNMRAAFLEVVNDALGSVAVLVAAAVIAVSGWQRADAVASLLIGVLIVPRTLRLLRESVDVLMESTPKNLDLGDVRRHVLDVDHVHGVHDLHATQVATGLPVFSAHVVVDDSCFHDGHLTGLLDQIQSCLAGHFDVQHSTIQFEATSHVDHEPAAHD